MRMVKAAMAAAVLLGFVGAVHGQTISIGFASEPGRALATSGVSLPERNGYVVTVSHPLGVDWLEATSELSRTEAEGSAVPRVLAGVRVSPVDVAGFDRSVVCSMGARIWLICCTGLMMGGERVFRWM